MSLASSIRAALASRVLAVAVVASAIVAPACTSEDSGAARTRRCEQLRDHLVELRLAGRTADLDAHRAALKQTLGDTFVRECSSDLSSNQISCALASTDSKHAMECTRGRTSKR